MSKKLPEFHNETIFHTYDVRGLSPSQINPEIAYKIARNYFKMVEGERFVIGYDMRESSPILHNAFILAANHAGKQVDSLGMCATDMLYFALGRYDYDGGVMITASHNPEIWNGIKLMRKGVVPIDMSQLRESFDQDQEPLPEIMSADISYTEKNYVADYVGHVTGFVDSDALAGLKIVIDAGNGMGGINARNIFSSLPSIQVDYMHLEPNAWFPHHEANPAVEANTRELAQKVRELGADLGIAFDGDADRCFFVDENGDYITGPHAVALLTRLMLEREPAATIIHDHTTVFAQRAVIAAGSGASVTTQTGHSFYKHALREHNALFGGENSGHYYFRDNYFAENGVIPALIVMEAIVKKHKKLSELVSDLRDQFFVSGNHNFVLFEDVGPDTVYAALKERFHGDKEAYPDGLVLEFSSWRLNARMSNTEPKMRINIEALTEAQVDRAVTEVHELMSEFGVYQGDNSWQNIGKTNEQKFDELINNLWFTWNPHYILPWIDLYGDGWRKNLPPGKFYSDYGREKYERVLTEKSFEVDQSLRLMGEYLNRESRWFDRFLEKEGNEFMHKLKENPIAYFCLEYGLVDWMQIYSGGLGILAGDFIKQASDSGVPLVGVGVFYHQGFFHQDLDDQGQQIEKYLAQDPFDYPLELVLNENGEQLEISIEIIDHEVWVRAWKFKVGEVDLYLLDTNFDKNERYEDKMITAHLYGGDQDTRIRQEILLGIGGARILKAVGVEPSIYHMNEGHSGFLVLEIARTYIEDKGMAFHDAVQMVDDHLVFTNHTLKQAGNDIFPFPLIEKFLSPYLDNLQTDIQSVYELGKDQLYAQGQFSMTVLGLRNARVSNAVSKLHGQAAKKLWPDHQLAAVTNGVHMPTWVAPEIHFLLDEYVGENWHEPYYTELTDYNKVHDIPDEELWNAHKIRKEKLITTLNQELGLDLEPEALTIAWARRLASYKRPDLIMSDLDRLADIVNHIDRPVQILLAGKAHPQDAIGKGVLQEMWRNFSQERFHNKVVIIPGYNWQLARRMVSGADIWLNTPFRYEEASGTSGMKAAANGVLQFTTLDGWTDEIDWEGIGWVISEDDPAGSLYDALENQIRTLFFEHTNGKFSSDWVKRMKKSMVRVLHNYSTHRMMHEYLQDIYAKVLK